MLLKVNSIKKEAPNTISIILEKPVNFDFYPGQYLDIELPVIPVSTGIYKDSRILSISSSPTENFVMVTYNLGVSEYKRSLQQIKKGDVLESSHPAGTVVIDDSSPIIMIAGGIGIAPYRSMIKWAVDKKINTPVILVYSNSDADFIFKKELDIWKASLPNLKIHYINTKKNGRLTKEKLINLVDINPKSETIFYLAGAPSMVDDFENILLDLKIESFNIRTDRFDGY